MFLKSIYSHFKNFIIILFVWSSSGCIGQEVMIAHYHIIPDMMLSLIEKYPEKKEEIERRIEEQHLPYMDFILIDSTLVQVTRAKDLSIKNIKIFSNGRIFQIDDELRYSKEELKADQDSVFVTNCNSNEDSTNCYEIFEKNAMPLKMELKTYIDPNHFSGISLYNNYPEAGFIIQTQIFPKKIICGNPKTFMTFELIKPHLSIDTFTYEKIKDLINRIHNKSARQDFFEILSEHNSN